VFKYFFITIVISLSLTSLVCGQAVQQLIEKGNAAYHKRSYDEAKAFFESAVANDMEHKFPQALFNLGNTLYQQKKYRDAAQQFIKLTTGNISPSFKTAALYNLGNCHLAEKSYQDAIAAYKLALKINPHDEDAKYNLTFAKAILASRQKEPPQKNLIAQTEQATPPPANLKPPDLQRLLEELNESENKTMQQMKQKPQHRKKAVKDW
jgi:tetratricopeptide (TPR) repeat protein